MNKFLYLVFMSTFYITVNCLGDGHAAYAGFRFYNSLEENVQLVAEKVKEDCRFDEIIVQPYGRILFEKRLTNYEGFDDPEKTEDMLTISVNVGAQTAGRIKLVHTSRPDPSVRFETKKGSGLELRQKFFRFGGGGPMAIEIRRASAR